VETTHRRISDSNASVRRFAGTLWFAALLMVALAAPTADSAPHFSADRNSLSYFRHEMRFTVRADHPAIVPVAAAIRAITTDPLQQLAVINDVTTLLVEYDDDMRVYGVDDFHATLDEMIARRRAAGWAYLRDDCDGRAVFAAHLLAALGIPWRLEASYWKEHAWVVARVNGVDYDLLDLRDNARETDRTSYKLIGHFFVHASHPPPAFAWREAWAAHTHHDLHVALALGMVTLDSTALAMHARHAKDWTLEAPNEAVAPADDARIVLAGIAGFPFGESLHVGAMAAAKPPAVPTTPAASAVLGAATSANTSP
jgi:hypothetical protein